jgi:hypothetical protein
MSHQSFQTVRVRVETDIAAESFWCGELVMTMAMVENGFGFEAELTENPDRELGFCFPYEAPAASR